MPHRWGRQDSEWAFLLGEFQAEASKGYFSRAILFLQKEPAGLLPEEQAVAVPETVGKLNPLPLYASLCDVCRTLLPILLLEACGNLLSTKDFALILFMLVIYLFLFIKKEIGEHVWSIY